MNQPRARTRRLGQSAEHVVLKEMLEDMMGGPCCQPVPYVVFGREPWKLYAHHVGPRCGGTRVEKSLVAWWKGEPL